MQPNETRLVTVESRLKYFHICIFLNYLNIVQYFQKHFRIQMRFGWQINKLNVLFLLLCSFTLYLMNYTTILCFKHLFFVLYVIVEYLFFVVSLSCCDVDIIISSDCVFILVQHSCFLYHCFNKLSFK